MLQVPKPTRGNNPDGAGTLSRGTMVHEMIHGWVGGISGSSNTQWFGEGATTYFTARTELGFGLMPLEALAREYTNLSRDYYPNPVPQRLGGFRIRRVLAQQGGRATALRAREFVLHGSQRADQNGGGWSSLARRRDVRAVRQTGGERRRCRRMISAAVAGELDLGAAAEFDSIVVRGTKTIVLAPDTFGPCFSRRTVTIPVPDFLFRRNETRRIVTGLRGESAAFQAGLRDGDEVTNQVDVGAPRRVRPPWRSIFCAVNNRRLFATRRARSPWSRTSGPSHRV